MRWFLFDIEVYPKWFCIVIKEKDSGKYGVISSDQIDYASRLNRVRDIMAIKNNIFIGYNIKSYDLVALNHLFECIKALKPIEYICDSLFTLSQDIIENHNKAGYPYNMCTFTDLKDDVYEWLSLKEYESNKGLEIKETDIPFGTISLTLGQKQQIIQYCCRDVDATESMLSDRWNYIGTKMRLAQRFGLDIGNSLKRTDPSLVCDILVKNKNFDKSFLLERITYTIPARVEAYIKKYLPKWLVNIFLDYDHFEDANKTFELFENIVTIGLGGLHSVHRKNNGKPNEILFVGPKKGFVNVTIDVKSYYPNLICKFDYQSRATTDLTLYPGILDERMRIKPLLKVRPELKQDSDDLKLVLNSAGGAYQQQFLALYDPKQYIGRCFTGQLLLLALCKQLYDDCHAKIIQTNTDGIVMILPVEYRQPAYDAIKAWEVVTQMEFDIDTFDRLWQNNVNNYIMTHTNGKPKLCGSWDYNIDPFHNICFPILQKAMLEYLVNGKAVSETICAETNPMMFLYTTKRGPTFDQTIMVSRGRKTVLNKVNRVYVARVGSADCGSIFKVKGDYTPKMPNCPPTSKVYNQAVTTIPSDLDINWYIKEAQDAISRLVRIDI